MMESPIKFKAVTLLSYIFKLLQRVLLRTTHSNDGQSMTTGSDMFYHLYLDGVPRTLPMYQHYQLFSQAWGTVKASLEKGNVIHLQL